MFLVVVVVEKYQTVLQFLTTEGQGNDREMS